jgi:hypothetical protein
MLQEMWRIPSIFGLGIILCAGCASSLETGYKPRLLGDSDVRRRAYYAGQFTTEAKAAEQEHQTNEAQRRPRPGAGY